MNSGLDNDISDEGLIDISKGIAQVPSLQHLSIEFS